MNRLFLASFSTAILSGTVVHAQLLSLAAPEPIRFGGFGDVAPSIDVTGDGIGDMIVNELPQLGLGVARLYVNADASQPPVELNPFPVQQGGEFIVHQAVPRFDDEPGFFISPHL